MTKTYGVDIRKLTYAELWRMAPGASFLVAAWSKACGVPLKMEARICSIDALSLYEEPQIPTDVAGPLGGLVRQWRELGFQPALYYGIPFPNPHQRNFAAALLSPDTLTCGQAFFAETTVAARTRSELQANCFSAMTDGTFVGVSSEKKRMNSPPEFRGANLPGHPPRDLYERHRRELARLHRSFPVPQSAQSLNALILRLNNRHIEFQAARGVYVPTGG